MNLHTPPRVLSVIPPMTQLNTPYPSTAYLTGFLRSRGVQAVQADLALALVLELLNRAGLQEIHHAVQALPPEQRTASVEAFDAQFERYAATINPTIAFLQGHDATLAHRIGGRQFLPEGPRFASLDAYVDPDDPEGGDPLAWAFGALGQQDRARHLATLYLNDLADVVRDAVDARFEFVRYAESLAMSQPSFDPLAQALAAPLCLVDRTLERLTLQALAQHQPTVVLLSVPFPGAVYGALRIAQAIKAAQPQVRIALGGGYVNTELRELAEPRLFNFVDAVTLDAGERPLLALLEHWHGTRSRSRLVRTFVRDEEGAVRWCNFAEADIPFEEVGTPTWDGLPLRRYLSLLDMLNPMHRLWSDGRWNKLTVAHGCYWKKCSFCDVSLDYISRFDAATAETLADRIEAIVAETGQTGFHFVDEAAPPKSLKALAAELKRRQLAISWWGNVRFEKTFTPELCQELARVTKAFSDAGILVHAYLMYGFPTQTVQDTVDALEYVRQLFVNGCIQSGFFHRFACTVHSPVGQRPQDYGVTLLPLPPGTFARNDIGFVDPTGTDHDTLGVALKKALYNYMHGIGLEEDVRSWFTGRVPRTTVHRHRIARALDGAQTSRPTAAAAA